MNNIKILFIDDELNVLKCMERLFIDDDFEILTADSGEEGLSILSREYPIQVVISDYKMPGMNGVEFLREVNKKWPETIRMIFSGYADLASVVSAINEGQIYKFIAKPWKDSDIRDSIKAALEVYTLYKKNKELDEELKKKNKELAEMNLNLEKLVSLRTEELEFQNEILKRSQNILHFLPVGVIGIDTDYMIVQANKKTLEILGIEGRDIIGFETTMLPDEINNFISEIIKSKNAIRTSVCDIKIKGSFMKCENQEGIILILDKE